MSVVRSLFFLLAALLTASSALAARGSVPLQDYEDVLAESSDGKPLTAEQVRKAIVAGASRSRWAASEKSGDTVRLTYSVRDHAAVVDVVYSAKSYSIRYADSSNLNYSQEGGKPVIHPNYNRWVNQLRQAINLAVRSAQD
jgi:hypothetical protein